MKYFGEESQPCKKCSNCINQLQRFNLIKEVQEALKKGDLNSNEIASLFSQNVKENLINILKTLLEEGKVSLLKNNKYSWNG